jgi:hypothetical protein
VGYLKKWTEESFQDLESYSWVTLNRSSSWSDVERTSSLVVETVQSVQLAKSEMYNEYVYVKQYLTRGTISEWTAKKTLPAQRWTEMICHFNKNHLVF